MVERMSEQADSGPGETAFGDPSHAAFNEQLNAPSEPNHDALTSPWISPDQYPAMHEEFADNSDPTMKAQRLAQELTEAERRREQSGEAGGNGGNDGHSRQRGSQMVATDSMKPTLKPSHHLRGAADAQSFNQRWMIEKRDAALAAADLGASRPQHSHNHAHGHTQGHAHGPSM